MTQTIRVSLPGYNALTDTDPDHFALYADEDWVLIKELTRGSVVVPAGQTRSVSWSLSYIPLVLVYVREGNTFRTVSGQVVDYSDNTESGTSLPYVGIFSGAIGFINPTGSSVEFKYFICYDQQI